MISLSDSYTTLANSLHFINYLPASMGQHNAINKKSTQIHRVIKTNYAILLLVQINKSNDGIIDLIFKFFLSIKKILTEKDLCNKSIPKKEKL